MQYTTASNISSSVYFNNYSACDYVSFKQLCLNLVHTKDYTAALSLDHFASVRGELAVFQLHVSGFSVAEIGNVAACLVVKGEETKQLIEATVNFIYAMNPYECTEDCESYSALQEIAECAMREAVIEEESTHDLSGGNPEEMTVQLFVIIACCLETRYSVYLSEGWVKFDESITYKELCDLVRVLKTLGYCGANLKVQFRHRTDGTVMPRLYSEFEPASEVVDHLLH